MLRLKTILSLLMLGLSTSMLVGQVCDVTSDVNDICIGDEVQLMFDYPPIDNFSVEFNGVDQFVEIPHAPTLDFGTSNFSVEFLFRPDQVTGPAYMLSKISTAGVGYAIGLNAGLLTVYVNDGVNPPVNIVGTSVISTSNTDFYHVAVTFDRAGLCILYLDGFVDAQQTIAALGSIANTDPIGVGGPAVNIGGLATFLDGKVDEVRVWGRALPSSEILSRMASHLNSDSQISLAGYWDFNEGSGTGVIDCGESNQDGTLTNGASFSVDGNTMSSAIGVTWTNGQVGFDFYDSPEDTTWYVASGGYCKYECTDSLRINVLPCDSNKENFTVASVWIPNAFTPNDDNNNDVLTISASFITSYEFMIFGRNGNIVFHSQNIANSWDGSFEGKDLPDGAYVYMVIYKDLDNVEHREQGYISIIR